MITTTFSLFSLVKLESQMHWKAGETVTGDDGVRGYNDDQPCGCGASSMQQTRGLQLASHYPSTLQNVGPWSTFFTHTPPTLSSKGDINELPACCLQCAVIWSKGLGLNRNEITHLHFGVWAAGWWRRLTTVVPVQGGSGVLIRGMGRDGVGWQCCADRTVTGEFSNHMQDSSFLPPPAVSCWKHSVLGCVWEWMNEYDLSDAITETVAGALNKIKF